MFDNLTLIEKKEKLELFFQKYNFKINVKNKFEKSVLDFYIKTNFITKNQIKQLHSPKFKKNELEINFNN